MCVDSLVSLVPVVWEYATDALRPLRRHYLQVQEPGTRRESHETETPERLVPNSWVLYGLGGSIILGTFLVWLVFGDRGIKPWATVLGFVLGGMLSVIG
jgi:hypothetical protein